MARKCRIRNAYWYRRSNGSHYYGFGRWRRVSCRGLLAASPGVYRVVEYWVNGWFKSITDYL